MSLEERRAKKFREQERFPLMQLNLDPNLHPSKPECQVEPHPFIRMDRWRFWLCLHCYAPRSLHPRTYWVRARPLLDYKRFSAAEILRKTGW